MSNLVHNEQVKYKVTFFNNIAIASFVTGAVAPVF